MGGRRRQSCKGFAFSAWRNDISIRKNSLECRKVSSSGRKPARPAWVGSGGSQSDRRRRTPARPLIRGDTAGRLCGARRVGEWVGEEGYPPQDRPEVLQEGQLYRNVLATRQPEACTIRQGAGAGRCGQAVRCCCISRPSNLRGRQGSAGRGGRGAS